jgi:hypothetical protein
MQVLQTYNSTIENAHHHFFKHSMLIPENSSTKLHAKAKQSGNENVSGQSSRRASRGRAAQTCC